MYIQEFSNHVIKIDKFNKFQEFTQNFQQPFLNALQYQIHHSIRNVILFLFFKIKASFQQKKSDFMSLSLKRCIQACQFSPIYLKVRIML